MQELAIIINLKFPSYTGQKVNKTETMGLKSELKI